RARLEPLAGSRGGAEELVLELHAAALVCRLHLDAAAGARVDLRARGIRVASTGAAGPARQCSGHGLPGQPGVGLVIIGRPLRGADPGCADRLRADPTGSSRRSSPRLGQARGQAVPSATFSVTLYSRYIPSISRVWASSAGSTLNTSPTGG